jgi:hypothetical protein
VPLFCDVLYTKGCVHLCRQQQRSSTVLPVLVWLTVIFTIAGALMSCQQMSCMFLGCGTAVILHHYRGGVQAMADNWMGVQGSM